MSTPFDSDSSEFCVLVNEEEQYSMWPAHLAIPSGWTKVFGPSGRAMCQEYVEKNWTDMRPKSLRMAMSEMRVS